VQRCAAGHETDLYPTDCRAAKYDNSEGERRIDERGQDREQPGEGGVPAGPLCEKVPTRMNKGRGKNKNERPGSHGIIKAKSKFEYRVVVELEFAPTITEKKDYSLPLEMSDVADLSSRTK
jgi:hypothetical protein